MSSSSQCLNIDQYAVELPPIHSMVSRCKPTELHADCFKTMPGPCSSNPQTPCCYPKHLCNPHEIQSGICYKKCDPSVDQYCYVSKNCTSVIHDNEINISAEISSHPSENKKKNISNPIENKNTIHIPNNFINIPDDQKTLHAPIEKKSKCAVLKI